MPTIKYFKTVGSYETTRGDGFEDTDYIDEEVEFEVSFSQLKKNKFLVGEYIELFADKYGIPSSSAKEIIEDYGILFEDDEINDSIFEEYAEMLYDRYCNNEEDE